MNVLLEEANKLVAKKREEKDKEEMKKILSGETKNSSSN